jgi:hypothetical protein
VWVIETIARSLKCKFVYLRISYLNLYRYGPTTRRKWQSQLSTTSLDGSAILLDETEQPRTSKYKISSDSDDEPEKKRKRRKYKERAKSTKARKNIDETSKATNESRANLSADAQDGIELMHQMTCAVSGGHSINEMMLSDLTNGTTTNGPAMKKRATVNGRKSTTNNNLMMFPDPHILLSSKRSEKGVAENEYPNAKYPKLEVFLCKSCWTLG